MKNLLLILLCLPVSVAGCQLFEDVSEIRFLDNTDSGHDLENVTDAGDADVLDTGDHADADDLGTDATTDMSVDLAHDMAEDLADGLDESDAGEDLTEDVLPDMPAGCDTTGCAEGTFCDAPTGLCEPLTCLAPLVVRGNACIEAGLVCTAATGLIGGTCDPVAQTGCQAGNFCGIRFSNGVFERVCLVPPASTVGEGQACNATACEPGFGCFAGTCRRFCDVSNGAGCRSTESCAPPLAPTHGIGFCDEDCTLD